MLVRTPLVVCPLLFVPSDLVKIDQSLRVLRPIAALCEMRPLCQELAMCERKAKKDAQVAVVPRAACVSRAQSADASRLALSGWGRPAWSLCRSRTMRKISLFSVVGAHCVFDHDFFPSSVQFISILIYFEV